jgi:hypothetical protein
MEDSACDDAIISGEGAIKALISLSRFDASNSTLDAKVRVLNA